MKSKENQITSGVQQNLYLICHFILLMIRLEINYQNPKLGVNVHLYEGKERNTPKKSLEVFDKYHSLTISNFSGTNQILKTLKVFPIDFNKASISGLFPSQRKTFQHVKTPTTTGALVELKISKKLHWFSRSWSIS